MVLIIRPRGINKEITVIEKDNILRVSDTADNPTIGQYI